MLLPKNYRESMKRLLGSEYESYIKCMDADSKQGLRVNTSKISVEEFKRIAPFPIEPIPWITNGFYYQDVYQPAKHSYYYAGLYYLQEPSAMTPASRLPVMPGDRVLDLCAAPGGKATELGTRLKGEGLLAANDISSTRAKALLKNLELAGVPNLCVISEAPEKLAAIYAGYFDKILVDAPCSGEGMFRREPRMMRAWEENGPDYYAALQRDLVLQAAVMLRPGGMMMYSTCTFSETENELVVQHLLNNRSDMELVEMLPYEGFVHGKDAFAKCVRIFPHKMDGEGHFLALFQKKGEVLSSQGLSKQSGDILPKEAKEFLSHVKCDLTKGYFRLLQDKLYYLPEGYRIEKKIRYLRSGLYIGEIKKKRFEPSQALAMALTKDQFAAAVVFDREDIRTVKYLKGETVEIADPSLKNSSWVLVCVDAYPLGWGKIQNGMLKNKYYSGWRIQ